MAHSRTPEAPAPLPLVSPAEHYAAVAAEAQRLTVAAKDVEKRLTGNLLAYHTVLVAEDGSEDELSETYLDEIRETVEAEAESLQPGESVFLSIRITR
jgi:hypothetical protein